MTIEIRNPAAPATVVATYQETPESELDAIVARARAAQRAWARVPQPERGRLVSVYMDALEARSEDIAMSMTREMGKKIGESRGEVAKGIAEGRMTAARAGAPIGEVLPSQVPGVTAYSMRRPRGLILGINPWNFPFSTPMRKSIPALVYGNAILLKPASMAPGAALMMAEFAKGILPDDLVSVVLGAGRIGQALAEHPGVDGVSFTGSVGVGKTVAAAAASHLAEISLELGGQNPVILNDASDLEPVLDQVTTAALAVCGQRCTAVSRIIVRRNLAKAVTEGLARRFNDLEPGDGADPDTGISPLASARQRDEVAGFVDRARAEGASIAAGGTVPEGLDGHYYAPTLVTDVTPDMEIAREEVFGPVVSVLTYDTVDEALEIANGVAYGLSSCLYSEQAPVIEAFLGRSESGMLHVNAGSFPENHLPFVGIKDSAMGVGGSNGASTIQFYTTEHAVYRKASA